MKNVVNGIEASEVEIFCVEFKIKIQKTMQKNLWSETTDSQCRIKCSDSRCPMNAYVLWKQQMRRAHHSRKIHS